MVRAMVETAAPGVPDNEVFAEGMADGYRRGTNPPAMHFWSGADPVATGWPAWGYRSQAQRVLPDGDVARAAYDAGLEALRPGRTFGHVVEAVHKPLDAAGPTLAEP